MRPSELKLCVGTSVKTVGIRLELDATAAKGILDRTGLAKVRHIDVNCLWLQEQCAKKIVPLNKIPGEHNSADLMTKHLTLLMIKRHLEQLCLEFKEGRSDKAAKLHSVTRLDYWSERGESGRWVRVHTQPRTSPFMPLGIPRGPGRKTRLTNVRSTKGIDSEGNQFKIEDLWDSPNNVVPPMLPWTGRTIFLVDKSYSDRWGTDQRRQRDEVSNLVNPQSEKGDDLFVEEAHSAKPRWMLLSD